ncbi:hypothetical protein B566_EDAN011743 [Ephemera danica]|nr:hypothetical protein B566_EDAN011743 [Ephemera danica]
MRSYFFVLVKDFLHHTSGTQHFGNLNYFYITSIPFNLLNEPTGRTSPKVSGDGLNKHQGMANSIVALLCDAQAFPAPKMR